VIRGSEGREGKGIKRIEKGIVFRIFINSCQSN